MLDTGYFRTVLENLIVLIVEVNALVPISFEAERVLLRFYRII